MNDISGLVYLLNQAGASLAEANRQLVQLHAENQELRAQLALSGNLADKTDDA